MTDSSLQPLAASIEVETRLQNFLAGREPDAARPRKYDSTDPAELQRQLNGVADIQAITIKQRDQLQTDLRETKAHLESLTLKFWIVSAAVVVEGAIITFLAQQLFNRL